MRNVVSVGCLSLLVFSLSACNWAALAAKEGGWIKFQEPPLFKTFQMNGQTCTVYPGCTE